MSVEIHSCVGNCSIDLINMNIQINVQLILVLSLWPGFISMSAHIKDVGDYSRAIVNTILDIYPDNNSFRRRSTTTNSVERDTFVLEPIVYPYILLGLWIVCIISVVCCCLYCKCQQAEQMTSYNCNNFELQEVHVLDHPLPHVKGCVCLCCLQRQVASEIEHKNVN